MSLVARIRAPSHCLSNARAPGWWQSRLVEKLSSLERFQTSSGWPERFRCPRLKSSANPFGGPLLARLTETEYREADMKPEKPIPHPTPVWTEGSTRIESKHGNRCKSERDPVVPDRDHPRDTKTTAWDPETQEPDRFRPRFPTFAPVRTGSCRDTALAGEEDRQGPNRLPVSGDTVSGVSGLKSRAPMALLESLAGKLPPRRIQGPSPGRETRQLPGPGTVAALAETGRGPIAEEGFPPGREKQRQWLVEMIRHCGSRLHGNSGPTDRFEPAGLDVQPAASGRKRDTQAEQLLAPTQALMLQWTRNLEGPTVGTAILMRLAGTANGKVVRNGTSTQPSDRRQERAPAPAATSPPRAVTGPFASEPSSSRQPHPLPSEPAAPHSGRMSPPAMPSHDLSLEREVSWFSPAKERSAQREPEQPNRLAEPNEDPDLELLAGKLQRILDDQARRHGIDV